MTGNLTMTVQHTGDLALIAVSGEIDVVTAASLRVGALEVIENGCPRLVLDLGRVTFCDSSGFNALINILRSARNADGSLALTAVPDRLARMLELTGVGPLLATYPAAPITP
ncbi:STAS domain-containing protein [Streptomyces sp. NPDC003042]